jgi:hypothetical protein
MLSDDWAQGLSPYRGECLYIYAPPWYYLISLMSYVSRITGFSFDVAVKVPLIIADAAIFGVMILSGLKMGLARGEALKRASFLFLNPISLMTTGVHGQFDNLSLLFLLLSWFAFTFKKTKAFFWGCLSLSASVLMKHFSAMMAFVMGFNRKEWREKALVIFTAPLLFIAFFLPYWRDFEGINRVILHYNLHGGYWGWLGVICRGTLFFTGYDIIQQPYFHWVDSFNAVLYVGIIAASWWVAKRYSLLDSIIVIFLIFYSFTTQIGVQYTLWILPFAALARPNRYFFAYTIVGTIQLAAFYYAHYHWWREIPIQGTLQNLIPETYVLFRYLTWTVCILWLIHAIRRRAV